MIGCLLRRVSSSFAQQSILLSSYWEGWKFYIFKHRKPREEDSDTQFQTEAQLCSLVWMLDDFNFLDESLIIRMSWDFRTW